MKSTKIVAMLVAFTVLMAIATSGLAATVATTTKYNAVDNKVVVDVIVEGVTGGKEVTYLVESGDEIVYIDQKTADEDGNLTFNYKVAQDDIVDLSANVQMGTDGAIVPTPDDFVLDEIGVDAANATVKFYKDANTTEEITGDIVVGAGETIYAKIEANDGYELESVTIAGVDQDIDTDVYEIVVGSDIVVTVTEVQNDPDITVSATVNPEVITEGENVGLYQAAVVIQTTGAPYEVGAYFNGQYYAALNAQYDKYAEEGLCAVRIIYDGTEISANEIQSYVIATEGAEAVIK